MDALLLARIGLSRLRLPVPMAKLEVIHGAARALCDPGTSTATWEAFLHWMSILELESEVLEALCILVLARDATVMSLGALRSAMHRPSILSDTFIREAFGTPILVNSWAKAHSGEVPPFYRSNNIETEISEGRIVPPILSTRLRRLETASGKPLMKQWAYEFDRLLARIGPQSDGHWSYFSSDDRQRATGQFIARRGHLARSAYLRTFALAFDRWGMPWDMACAEAMYATPADFSFLRMPPGSVPNWALPLHQAQPSSREEWEEVLETMARTTFQHAGSRLLLHLNAPTHRSERYQADAELITLLYSGERPSIEEAFRMHDWLPGRVYLERSSDWQFAIERSEPDGIFPCDESGGMLPALLPAVGPCVGYLHADLVGRMPYLPANYSRRMHLRARPRRGGADVECDGQTAGEFRYWNWRWSPTHDMALGTPGGVAVTLSAQCAQALLHVPGMQWMHVWRATVLTRESDYGAWQESVLSEAIPISP